MLKRSKSWRRRELAWRPVFSHSSASGLAKLTCKYILIINCFFSSPFLFGHQPDGLSFVGALRIPRGSRWLGRAAKANRSDIAGVSEVSSVQGSD